MSYEITPPMPAFEPPPPPKKSRTNAIIIGSAVAAITAIIGVGVTINSSSGGGSHKAEPAASGPASPTSTASPDIAQQFADWRDGGGMKTLDTLSKDLSAVSKASDPVDLDGLRDSCSTLTADVEAAQDGDPLPDPATDKRWNLALEHLANSATACTTGAVGNDQASFDLMASEMDIGIKHLNAVNERLDEVLGS
ncbi:hypothetical protein [Streptomyces sp. NPDC003710]